MPWYVSVLFEKHLNKKFSSIFIRLRMRMYPLQYANVCGMESAQSLHDE